MQEKQTNTEEPSREDLVAELQRTNELLRRYTSLRFVLLRGMLSGFAGFIGATLLIAIILGFLSKLVFVPVLGEFIAELLKVINEYQQTPHSPSIQ